MKTRNGLTLKAMPTTPSEHESLNHAPVVGVFDGEFYICNYYAQTLKEAMNAGRGVCVTSGRYEKYRSLELQDLEEWFDLQNKLERSSIVETF